MNRVNDAASSTLAIGYRELEGVGGQPPKEIWLADFEVKPLNYEMLATAKLGKLVTLELELSNARVISTNVESIDLSKNYNGNAVFQSQYTSKVIGLIKGGWLPSGLGAFHSQTLTLLDRNAVTDIVSRSRDTKRLLLEPDFIDLFYDLPIRISPILYALEGNNRSIPEPNLVNKQLGEVLLKLRKALPKAQMSVTSNTLEGILGLIEDDRVNFIRGHKFLMQLAPNLSSPVSREKRDLLWQKIKDTALTCELRLDSIVVLAALSSVAVPGGMSPARGLLNFKDGYSAGDAYNALADLHSLIMLINIFGTYPNARFQLCTADKKLALFWTGIRASNFGRTPSGVFCDYEPVEQLLPREMYEKWLSEVELQSQYTLD